MSRHIAHAELRLREEVAAAPAHLKPNVRSDVDRSFGLPSGLLFAYAGLCMSAFALLATAFANPNMILPAAIIGIILVGVFFVPHRWTRMQPAHPARAMDMAMLMGSGIVTHTGLTKGRDAVAQVLILPTLILGWGIAVVSIAALV